MPRTQPLKGVRTLALLAMALASACACASKPRTPDRVSPPPPFVDTFPKEVTQGSLVRARITRGARVELLDAQGKATELRLGNDGGYVLGVGRDEAGPLR